jgi:cysteinyl-tRNA synthetase
MHNGFLNMGAAEKMSKSLGNIRTIPELQADGWHGEVLRLALLSAHYRQPLEWTESLLEECKAKLDSWYRKKHSNLDRPHTLDAEFVAALSDDLNTPGALARLSQLARTDVDKFVCAANMLGILGQSPENWAMQGRYSDTAVSGRSVGGVSHLVEPLGLSISRIDQLIAARTDARAAKNWAESDRIRDELAAAGIILEDGPQRTTWRRA